MIKLTTPSGRIHYLQAPAIARISETGVSSQWIGIKAHVKCFDGAVIECIESPDEIAKMVVDEGARPCTAT